MVGLFINITNRYIAWNVHEPEQGTFNFDGDADIVSFVKLVQETGLLLILRPGWYNLLFKFLSRFLMYRGYLP